MHDNKTGSLNLRQAARLRPLCAAMLLGLGGLASAGASAAVVLSQVYTAGGNSGATLKNDFIELFNAGTTNVNLSGWTVHYASATGTSWTNKTTLGDLTLLPGQYLLIQEGNGSGSGTQDLPTPDATGSIQMGAASGKVALTNANVTLTGAAPTHTALVDILSYGDSTPTEGTPTGTLSTAKAALRLAGGCTDTSNNSGDFTLVAPAPRTMSTAPAPCNGSPAPSPAPTPSPAPSPSPDSVSIHTIQGSGPTSPLVGQTVTTRGVVTKLLNNGFFMQEPNPDSDPTTSEGILVFTSTAPTVSLGQLVQLTGVVDEYNVGAAGNAQTAAHTVTELKTISNLSVLASGQSIAPTVVTFPEATDDDLEHVEGMLVTIATELTASQNYFLGRYGQITLSANGRLPKATNLYRPGSADAQMVDQDNARRRIILDDGSSLQNPNPTPYFAADNTQRAGDTIPSVTGVIDYGLATASNTGLADYRIHPTEPVVFTRVNQRTTAPDDVGGNVKVASFNVLNYFNGNGLGSGFPTSRGATTLEEFNRQRAKIIAAIKAIDADALGLMEIENDGTGAQSAVVDLVNGLNAAMGAGTYAVVPDPATGTGSDEIKVAMIYKPAKLARVGSSLSDASSIHNRPPLAQAFAAANGEKFTLVVNHFKSKSCSDASGTDADQGDGQGCYNDRRVKQAQALRGFITNLQTAQADTDVLVIGDLNAYAKEDPVDELTSRGFVDLSERFNGPGDYSYVFDGETGYLDHALATGSLSAQATGAHHWHINADEPTVIDYNVEFKQPACAACGPDYYTATPYRSSDHDPVVIGLNLLKRVDGTSGRDTITGTDGDDVINGGEGADTITTGAGRDVVLYTSIRDGLDTITDFTPGSDRLDLSALLASIGVQASQALSQGVVKLVSTSAGVQVQIDTDGNAGPAAARPLALLRGVTAAQLQPARDLGL